MARLGLYQPFIEDRNVRRLYRLKVALLERSGRKVPMTTIVNRILDDFFGGAGDAPFLAEVSGLSTKDSLLPVREGRSP